jgi:hypothetical protein
MVYYAHSLRKYNTIEEKIELEVIKRRFRKVYNPNNHKILQVVNRLSGYEAMQVYLNIVRAKYIKALVFSEHLGHIGRGVYLEILEAQEFGKPVYILRGRAIYPYTSQPRVVNSTDWKIKYAVV